MEASKLEWSREHFQGKGWEKMGMMVEVFWVRQGMQAASFSFPLYSKDASPILEPEEENTGRTLWTTSSSDAEKEKRRVLPAGIASGEATLVFSKIKGLSLVGSRGEILGPVGKKTNQRRWRETWSSEELKGINMFHNILRVRGRERWGRDQRVHRPLINEEKWEIHLTSYRAEILSSFFRSVFKKKNDKKEFG